MIIVTDTKEQEPFNLTGIEARDRAEEVIFRAAPLPVGDYGLQIPNTVRFAPFFIERKSKADLYGSLGSGRDREEAKCVRAMDAGYAYHMVIEDDLIGLTKPPPWSKRMSPKVVTRTLFSWSIRYNLHVWTPGPRKLAEILTFRLLEFAHKVFVEKGEGPQL